MPSRPITGRSGTGWTRLAACNAHSGSRRSTSTAAQRPWRLLHGFADYCLAAIAAAKSGPGVTVGFGCEFLDAAREGELIECDGEVTRAGGSLIFLRGTLRSGERKLFTFSGTIKRVKGKKPATGAAGT